MCWSWWYSTVDLWRSKLHCASQKCNKCKNCIFIYNLSQQRIFFLLFSTICIAPTYIGVLLYPFPDDGKLTLLFSLPLQTDHLSKHKESLLPPAQFLQKCTLTTTHPKKTSGPVNHRRMRKHRVRVSFVIDVLSFLPLSHPLNLYGNLSTSTSPHLLGALF